VQLPVGPQRANVVSWQVPLATALDVTVASRLRLHDQGAPD